jgi:agmatine deiminase
MTAPREQGGGPGPHARMPAEWEPHDATWIAWPHERSDWPGKFSTIPWTYAEIVRRLSSDEYVEVLVQSPAQLGRARRVLTRSAVDLERVRFHICPTDRSWTRDSGPSFVRTGPASSGAEAPLALVQWKFTGWAKYDNWQLDRGVPEWIARHLGLPLHKALSGSRWVVCEGGAFDVDGSGLLLATEECLLGDPQARNPGLGREALESVLHEYLGVEEVIWLRRGILGDDTHGHVDDVARFVGPRTVVTVTADDPSDLDFSALSENREVLDAYRSRGGARLEVRELPVPRPVLFGGLRLPASYANFYVANRTVLVPTFDDPRDADAIDVLRKAFPGREVVGIRARDLVWGFGTIHCLTQQQPAAHRASGR